MRRCGMAEEVAWMDGLIGVVGHPPHCERLPEVI